jgi:hypothetical protein
VLEACALGRLLPLLLEQAAAATVKVKAAAIAAAGRSKRMAGLFVVPICPINPTR